MPEDSDPTMRGPKASESRGRWAALRVLSDLREGRRTARAGIDRLVGKTQVPEREARFAHELVMGVLRHRLTLEHVLGRLARRGWDGIGRRLQDILLVAGYQLIYLDGVPDYAAINEAVEQAKREGGPRTARFVNGLLRGLQRSITQPRASIDSSPSRHALPIGCNQCCRFGEPILPDADTQLAEHLSVATSHPTYLVSTWLDQYGPAQAAEICRVGMERPTLFLRPNPRKTTAIELQATLAAEGIEAEVTDDGNMLCVAHAFGLMRTRSHANGLFQVQDRIAALPVARMKLAPDGVVADLCAGLGTKATQMAERVGDKGRILAADVDEKKLDQLERNANRLGLTNIETVSIDRLEDRLARLERLDWILLDVPCSNTGVLARRPEARYRLTSARAFKRFHEAQRSLLSQAARLARPPSRIMYSTCSIDPSENESMSEWFAQTHPEWRLSDARLTLPAAGNRPCDWRDGGYWAVFESAS
jgi:16S rRNA (cytosine967-C5)-methyltransferase